MANHVHSTRTPLLPPAGALSPLLPCGAGSQPGPVTKAVRAIRPSEAATWEQRQRESEAEERAAMRALRRRVAQAVSDGIDFLDQTGGDPDFEADSAIDVTASDGRLYRLGVSSDDEPSLCGVGGHDMYGHTHEFPRKGGNAGGDLHDLEGEDEHGSDCDRGEDSLGWAANVGQLALGANTDDGDATALESHGAGFVRSGHEDDEGTNDAEAVNESGTDNPEASA